MEPIPCSRKLLEHPQMIHLVIPLGSLESIRQARRMVEVSMEVIQLLKYLPPSQKKEEAIARFRLMVSPQASQLNLLS